MADKVLVADWLPKGVTIHVSEAEGKFRLRWLYQTKPYQIEADDLMEGIGDAIRTIAALEHEGLV